MSSDRIVLPGQAVGHIPEQALGVVSMIEKKSKNTDKAAKLAGGLA